MANHKSSKKRIRQTDVKRLRNKYYHKTTRNAVRALRNTSDKEAAEKLAREKLWGTNSTTIDTDVNGKQKDKTQFEKTIDNEKQIIKELYHFSTNDQTEFWTKEVLDNVDGFIRSCLQA